MIKKSRDSKFIIYQVLYIFVITVLALKGADLDLRRVALEEDTVDKRIRDSLVTLLDSLAKQNIKFSIQIDPNVVVENEALRQKLVALNQQVEKFNEQVLETPPPPIEEEKPVEEQKLTQLPIGLKQTFIQHTWNVAKNTGDVETKIYDPRNMSNPIVVIPPGQEKRFDLTDQTELIAKFGSQEERMKVVANRPPDVKIERVTTKMNGSDIYVQDLQRITVFTVTIIDERPEQLKVSNSGPISVSGPQKNSKGDLVYNVSLKIASTENKFDDWLDKFGNLREPDGRYKVNFFFTVVDEKSKDRVQVGDSFYFTDFSK
ncbi:MAG TPA: hypothetical protein PKA80_04755 [Ignavibacteriaceae bacterium]|nr:hypothetical protein [Ignavibacteriaceae bacterium]